MAAKNVVHGPGDHLWCDSTCHTVSDYLQREDIDIVSPLQVIDTTVRTIKEMRNKRTFKTKLLKFVREQDVELKTHRKVSHHLDENWHDQHIPSYEESFCVGLYCDK